MIKKGIACLFAVLYFVFTTFSLWQVNSEDNRVAHPADESYEFAVASADDEWAKAINIDILAAKSLNKAPKHLSVSGIIKMPRASYVVPAFRNVLSLPDTGYHRLDISTATPLLYHAAIYLQNRVLRI